MDHFGGLPAAKAIFGEILVRFGPFWSFPAAKVILGQILVRFGPFWASPRPKPFLVKFDPFWIILGPPRGQIAVLVIAFKGSRFVV